MAILGSDYLAPGVYTTTNYENPTQGLLQGLRIPLFLGTGSESLTKDALELVRGSSSVIDQRIVDEDATGHAVVSISNTGAITLGDFDGTIFSIQVQHYPIVTGNGTGTTATNTSSVSVTINGEPTVVLRITGATGILKLATAPEAGDEVLVSYYYKRTDTRVTDNLSDQVTETNAVLYGQIGESYTITASVNDTFIMAIDEDDAEYTVTFTAGTWTAAQLVSFINSAVSGTSLVASTYVNNFGETAIKLTADQDITIGDGTSNSTLGFTNGDTTGRNRTFYTYQKPIVDGSNGGITTTDPADVSVTVDGTAVTVTEVDGQDGYVVLPWAPAVGSTVACTYYFNTWQDTYDDLADLGVTAVTLCGATPDRSDYVEGADFILQDNKILWGTAKSITSGVHTSGANLFGSNQITATLVDVRQYFAECVAVTNTSVSPPVTSKTIFTLPLVPTTGNGRDTPLGSSLFQTVSNSRIDLPTNRPDLVKAYWGFGIQDAYDRGEVTVTKVDSDTRQITLADPVPVGASVYATFWYNTIVDQEYTFAVVTPGASGVGTYSITDESGNYRYAVRFGSKSASLAGVTIVFPSGSERVPDGRHETPFTTTDYNAPVEETVTVTFAAEDSTLAKFTVPNSGPYYPVTNASDHVRLLIDGIALAGAAAGIDLSNIGLVGDVGFHAQMVGDEVSYDAGSGYTTYEIDATNRDINLTLDGVLIQASALSGTTQDLSDFVTALNEAATGHSGTAQAGAAASMTLAATSSDIDDYYVGWVIRHTNNSPVGVVGQTGTVTAYNGTTKVATVTPAWGTAPNATTTYLIYDPEAIPQYTAATRFNAATTITAGEYDELMFHYTGVTTGASGNITATITPGTYASATLLAAQIQTDITTAIGVLTWRIDVDVDDSSRLVFKLRKAYTDAQGFLEFITHGTPGQDFAILAGIDTDTATLGDQTKIVNGNIARRYTLTGDNTSALLWDRIILRNRLVPGQSSIDSQEVLDQASLIVQGSSGYALTGLTVNETAMAGWKATVRPATMLGYVDMAGGQIPTATYGDACDGQPVVTFYAAGGSTAQNNIFKFTFDGTPVTVQFTDAAGAAIATGGTADVPLGPGDTALESTVINQIATAMAAQGIAATAAAVIAAGYVRQEGAAIRFRSATSESTSSIIIGTGSANDVLGFVDGQTASRTAVETEELVSALMGHSAATTAGQLMTTWAAGPTTTYFADEALAKTVYDASNAKYLYLQSQGDAGVGTTSSIAWATATTADVMTEGVGLGVVSGDGSAGEAGISGYYVTSSDAVDGSGTVNTSLFNSGTGQDGIIGQTYRDLVTGLTFTILEREGGSNYPAAGYFTFNVVKTITTDSNLTHNACPGLEVKVSNTSGIGTGDTAIVETYERSGNEPAIGDLYYVTYTYSKQDFTTQLYTKFASIEAAYGTNSTDNPVTLASYLAILNGAVLVAIRQVQKDTDEDADGTYDAASMTAFRAALDDVEGAITGDIYPDIIVTLDIPNTSTASTTEFFQYVAKHCDIQSSLRYRAERTAIAGFAAGTSYKVAGDIATSVYRDRFRVVYPDMATVTLTDANAVDSQYLVDGSYIASALAGSVVSPTTDVATPWTGKKLYAFDGLGRSLDAVEMNQTAVRGVTILEDKLTYLRVRHGLTTQMDNVLHKLPTIRQIADEVQRQSRGTLERFIGIKFLPGVLSQIEGQLSNTLKLLVEAEILAAYTGVKAAVDATDPTQANVSAAYQPVFPLLLIMCTFSLRSSL